jgi:hypothetical protein
VIGDAVIGLDDQVVRSGNLEQGVCGHGRHPSVEMALAMDLKPNYINALQANLAALMDKTD